MPNRTPPWRWAIHAVLLVAAVTSSTSAKAEVARFWTGRTTAPAGPAYEVTARSGGVTLKSWGALPVDLTARDVAACGRTLTGVTTDHVADGAGVSAAWIVPRVTPGCDLQLRWRATGAAVLPAARGSYSVQASDGRPVGWIAAVRAVDARGAVLASRVVAESGDLRIAVSGETLRESTLPLALVVDFEPEAGPGRTASAMPIHRPDLAFDGRHFLAVWQDDRRHGRIHAGRFDAMGVPLGTEMISPPRVAGALQAHGMSQVAARSQGTFLVSWQTGDRESAWRSALVSATDGRVMNRQVLAVPSTGADQPRLAAGHRRTLAVWGGGRFPLRGLFLDAAGQADGPPFEILQAPGTAPGVVWSEGVFLVYWVEGQRDEQRVVAVRVLESSGELLDETPLVLSSPHGRVTGHTTATVHRGVAVVAWTQGPGEGDIRGARVVLPGGDVQEPRSALLAPAPARRDVRLQMVTAGDQMLLTWRARRNHSPTWAAWIDPQTLEATLLPEETFAGLQVAALAGSPAGVLLLVSGDGPETAAWLPAGSDALVLRGVVAPAGSLSGAGVGRLGGGVAAFVADDQGALSAHRIAPEGRAELVTLSVDCQVSARSRRPDLSIVSIEDGTVAGCTNERMEAGLVHLASTGPVRRLPDSRQEGRGHRFALAPGAPGFFMSWAVGQVRGEPSAVHVAHHPDASGKPTHHLPDVVRLHAPPTSIAALHGQVLGVFPTGQTLDGVWLYPSASPPFEIMEAWRVGQRRVVAAGDRFFVAATVRTGPGHDLRFATWPLPGSGRPHRWSLQLGLPNEPALETAWDGAAVVTCWTTALDGESIECRWTAFEEETGRPRIPGPAEAVRIPAATLTGLAPLATGRAVIQYEREVGGRRTPVVRVVSVPGRTQ